jgi:RimJ/RimL family protein N-acetyltransferase
MTAGPLLRGRRRNSPNVPPGGMFPTAPTAKPLMSDMGDQSMVTARLRLLAATVEHLEEELQTPGRLSELLGAVVPAGWPPGLYDRDAMAYFHVRLTEGGPTGVGWYSWYAIRRATADAPAVLVASGGYFGPPGLDGSVEIGYSVVPDYCGQGYATELVGALTNRALGLACVRRVVAEVHERNVASMKVLERCGFVRVGTGRETGNARFACEVVQRKTCRS